VADAQADKAISAKPVGDAVTVVLPELGHPDVNVAAGRHDRAPLVVKEVIADDEVDGDDRIRMLKQGFGSATINIDWNAPNPESMGLIEKQIPRCIGL
jgi:hypothetical protein